ncbi:MAG: GNAT family N-acetyltransferase [Gemmataceae bacterium]
MEIRLPECVIRYYRTDDAPSLARYANNCKVWRNLTDIFPHPYQLSDAEAYIAKSITAIPQSSFAIVVNGEAVGGIGLHPHSDVFRGTASLGYWLGEPFWGRGIATAAVRAITPWAFEHLDLQRIEAAVFAWNPASARVLEKCRYMFEGRLRRSVTKDGEVTDQLMYSILVDDCSRVP